ncbi:hypothetical protein O6H91_14G057400 [Diphasiastrum complanatum]|uniref:Uncharacterized protein n=9 Tax=Diphasiastrum complanatum TaxID=34168 RepID=A0ACC2BPU6_DIPCM|nr:hypothetical protein O6H91_14G057400 [Diphasiastrum complanatum]KAJ7531750.1 hypothetical protein O6H91_14G057400 [Diphasiastrum complanatum]KAJ7531751.1 hypothetical protein O6H91_14G057400 [Diphasiastrum complanatum]KAJ7531752.1 hypothetical protein O6H91_14G057400 [Diphasiastrum complanatum]KAJ7531753.1 hypothetical protein O6H91_14G057400 [Diphasiastrum complanatum]
MDSPEREPNEPTSSFQESPFYKYLCTLSPLKAPISLHVPQTYTELKFPSAPDVFVSPPPDSRKSLSRLRSCDLMHVASEGGISATLPVEKGLFGDSWGERDKIYESAVSVVDYGIYFVTEDGYQCTFHDNKTINKQEDNCVPKGSRNNSLHLDNTKEMDGQLETGPCEIGFQGIEEELFNLPYLQNFGIQDSKEEEYPSNNVLTSLTRRLTAECIKDSSQNTEENNSQSRIDELMEAPCIQEMTKNLQDVEGPQERKEQDVISMKFRVIKPRTRVVKHAISNSKGDKNSLPERTSAHDQSSWRSPHLNQNIPAIYGTTCSFEQGTSGLLDHTTIRNNETTELLVEEVVQATESSDSRTLSSILSIDCKTRVEEEINADKSSRENCVGRRGVRRRCLDFEVPGAKRSRSNFEIVGTMPCISGRTTLSSFATIIPPSSVTERAVATFNAKDNAQCFTVDFSNSYSMPGKEQNADDVTQLPPDMGKFSIPIRMATGIGLPLQNTNDVHSTMPVEKNFPSTGFVPVFATKDLYPETLEGPLLSADYNSVDSILNSAARLIAPFLDNSMINQTDNLAGFESQLRAFASSSFQPDLVQEQDGNGQAEGAFKSGHLENRHNGLHLPFLDMAEDSVESLESPNKRKTGRAGDRNGGRLCKCKKSRCLKLYCECFAAGNYCVDACTCHDCFNKPKYESTVLGTRQQIETRNPIAFAPKIVRATESSLNDQQEEPVNTPANSCRHKRGCSCKRSQCVKKYCECYQAGVGCSEGCRCEGCKNMFGLK